tara:strand:+ start:78 stop:275 length:198 start_codon:yes stop_codon:yes gene_type:complete
MPDNGLNNYQVTMHYEEGFTVRVIAVNEDHAKRIAFNRVEDQGTDCYGYIKAVHRDYTVTNVEEL